MQKSGSTFRYIDLIDTNIAQAVYYLDLVEANIKAGMEKCYEFGHLRSKEIAQGVHIYEDRIPKGIEVMKEKEFDDQKI